MLLCPPCPLTLQLPIMFQIQIVTFQNLVEEPDTIDYPTNWLDHATKQHSFSPLFTAYGWICCSVGPSTHLEGGGRSRHLVGGVDASVRGVLPPLWRHKGAISRAACFITHYLKVKQAKEGTDGLFPFLGIKVFGRLTHRSTKPLDTSESLWPSAFQQGSAALLFLRSAASTLI